MSTVIGNEIIKMETKTKTGDKNTKVNDNHDSCNSSSNSEEKLKKIVP